MKKSLGIKLIFTLGFIAMMFAGRMSIFAESVENGAVSENSLENLLDNSLIVLLKTGEQPAEIQFRDFSLRLNPRNEELRRLVETIRDDLDPSVMVETLCLYEKPAGAQKTSWTQAELGALYNEAAAISTLQGIQYYSASRKTMRTFYETSEVIDGPSTKTPLPDPVYATPPPEMTLYARQKDLTFGDNIYQYTYRLLPGVLVFTQENLTGMNKGIIPAVRKNKLRSILALTDAGEYLVIYAVSMAKAVALPGLKDRISNSFSNRAAAIIQWLIQGADRAFSSIQ